MINCSLVNGIDFLHELSAINLAHLSGFGPLRLSFLILVTSELLLFLDNLRQFKSMLVDSPCMPHNQIHGNKHYRRVNELSKQSRHVDIKTRKELKILIIYVKHALKDLHTDVARENRPHSNNERPLDLELRLSQHLGSHGPDHAVKKDDRKLK